MGSVLASGRCRSARRRDRYRDARDRACPRLEPAVDAARRDPALSAVSGFSLAAAIALIFLMTNKPDLTGSIVTAVLAVVAGIAFGLLRARR
jgi:hypothetical protein